MNIGEAIGDQLDQIVVDRETEAEACPQTSRKTGHRIIGLSMNPIPSDQNSGKVAVNALVERTMSVLVGPWFNPERPPLGERGFMGSLRVKTITVNPWITKLDNRTSGGEKAVVRIKGSIVGEPAKRYAHRSIKQIPETPQEIQDAEQAQALYKAYLATGGSEITPMIFPRFWALYKASDRLPAWEPQDATAEMIQERAMWAKPTSMMIRPVSHITLENQAHLVGILVEKPLVDKLPGFAMGWIDETTIYGDDSAQLGYKRLLARRHDAKAQSSVTEL